jgi:hypothetical protein
VPEVQNTAFLRTGGNDGIVTGGIRKGVFFRSHQQADPPHGFVEADSHGYRGDAGIAAAGVIDVSANKEARRDGGLLYR